jgi:hypothetical protein
MQNFEGMRQEELYTEIIYYIKHFDETRTCQNKLNSKNKLQPLAIRIIDVYWQKPGAASHMHTYVHGNQVIQLV